MRTSSGGFECVFAKGRGGFKVKKKTYLISIK
jgi:hypothetical protein